MLRDVLLAIVLRIALLEHLLMTEEKNTFRGTVGAKNTGSNGNAGPISAGGLPVDPAAQTYLKQIAAYQLWAEKQVSNAERDIANQNANQARIPIGRAGPAEN